MRNTTAVFRKLFSTFASLLRLPIQGSNRQGFKKKRNRLQQRVHTLAQIEIDQIKTCGVKGIILDLDNTIVSEDDSYLSPWAEDWITQAKLAGLQFFILSNGKRCYRVKFWSHRLDIPALSPAKKPFPPAFRHAMAYMQLPAKHVVVIGDSLHTDVVEHGCVGVAASKLLVCPIRLDGGKNSQVNGCKHLIQMEENCGNLMILLAMKVFSNWSFSQKNTKLFKL